jgi:ribulose 1,5-bisphosphate synthetase/thiazole synthase
MKTFKHFNIFPLLLLLATTLMGQDRTEIVIVGGGAGGTAAAIQAARQGAKVMVLEKRSGLAACSPVPGSLP